MSLPQPKDGDSIQRDPLGRSKRQAREEADKATATDRWWPVPGKPGFFINSAGRLKYDPFLDPSHPVCQRKG